MDLTRWKGVAIDPLLEFDTLQEEINRLFEGTRPTGTRGIFERSFSPALDVVENPDSYGILCDLPGVDLKDVQISVAGSIVTLKGEKKPRPELRVLGKRDDQQDFAYLVRERRPGDYFQAWTLDETIDQSKVDAVLRDGVLTVTLDVKEQVKPRTIRIRAQ